jgi:NAD(P)-dependent dehydrogenase (short-subunit alcohol dehydrogenase family)
MNNLFSLEGRVAAVTGGSRGIGEMITKGLLQNGCSRVYIISRNSEQSKETAKRLSEYGTCIPCVGDISTREGIDGFASKISEQEESLDILVNNAGAYCSAPFSEYGEACWDYTVNINMKTPFFLTQKLEPLLTKTHKTKGHLAKVINISSICGLSIDGNEAFGYTASKAGLIHLTKSLGSKLIKQGIAVSAIAPGAFPSEMNPNARDDQDTVGLKIPAGRVGSPDDIIGAVIYLASQAGDYVLGSTLIVDGGANNIQ